MGLKIGFWELSVYTLSLMLCNLTRFHNIVGRGKESRKEAPGLDPSKGLPTFRGQEKDKELAKETEKEAVSEV